MDHQNTFLNDLRKKIKNEENIDNCIWSFSYSHITIKISFVNKGNINEKKFLEIVKKEMTFPTFDLLMKLKFKNEINIKYVNNELWITWERERDREHPHGQVKFFCSGGGISYGTKLVVFGGVPVLEFGNSILIKNKKNVFFLITNLTVNTVFFFFSV